jgi:hypothetical protein
MRAIFSFKKSEAPSSRGISLERLNDLILVRGPVWDPWEPLGLSKYSRVELKIFAR